MLELLTKEYCPYCKRTVNLRLMLTHYYDVELGNAWDHDLYSPDLQVYFIFMCVNCEKLMLYHWDEPLMDRLEVDAEEIFIEDVREGLLQEDDDLLLPYIVWPRHADGRNLSETVPPRVREAYSRALRVKSEPNSFAVQIRRALEVICIDRGEDGKNLKDDLNNLSKAGVFPPIVAEIANELRYIGNTGAHVKPQTVKAEHIQAIDDFFHIVVNYVYEAPARLNAYRRLLSPQLPELTSGEIN
jgi:hypothetical protein